MSHQVDWRLRICAFAAALGLYLVISALVSTQSVQFPPGHYEIKKTRKYHSLSRPSAVAPSADSQDDLDDPGEQSGGHINAVDLPLRPRNLAGVVEVSKKNTPRKMRAGRKIDWCQPVGFKAAPGPVVALASFPGSGNTWVRYLLQQATGILTGSVYKDYALLKNGFPAESIVNGSVLIVKTHEFGEEARKPFNKAVILVRDPFSSLLAEFNRRSGGHIGYASADKYRRNAGRHWKNFVYNMAKDWERMNLDWYFGFLPKRRLIMFYDQLKENPERELRRLVDFLRVSVSNRTMHCVMDKREGIYKRSKRLLNFNPFDDGMKAMLNERQKFVYDILLGKDNHRNVVSTTSNELSTSNLLITDASAAGNKTA